MTVHEQISRIDSDIGRLQEKVKIYQGKISQLSERKKKLQERALLEQLTKIAPSYDQAEELLIRLSAEQAVKQANGGAENGSIQQNGRQGYG